MSPSESRFRDRKIVQWAVAYLAAAWFVLQLYDLFAERLEWEGRFFIVLLVALVCGFGVVLVLAWYHGEKGQRRISTPEFAILTTLLVLAGAVVSLGGRAPGTTAQGAALSASLSPRAVAVLPFENLSPDPADAFFTDGIHEEVITRLSQIAALKVISRTSVLQYRVNRPSIGEIGAQLGVGRILEGSVQRAGQRVRVTAKLIDARDDRNLWAESFERVYSVENVFAIQTEIASQVAQVLEAQLTPEEEQRLAEVPTDNLQAYEFWLQGNASRNLGYDERDVRTAIAMYQQATELDPEFAIAFARLARVHDDMIWFQYDATSERDGLVRSALERAQELAPDNPESLIAEGYYLYHRAEYEAAVSRFQMAEVLQPNWAEAKAGVAFVQRRMGRYAEAMARLTEVVELDPNSARQAFNLGETSLLMRDCVLARRYFERAISITPSWGRAHGYLIWVRLACSGDISGAREVLEVARTRVSNLDDPFLRLSSILVPLFSEDFPEALSRVQELPGDVLESQFFFLPRSFLEGEIRELEGQSSQARESFQEAAGLLRGIVDESPDDHRVHGALGLTLAYLGERDEAVREAEEGARLMPRTLDAYKALYREEDLARVYLILGDRDEATRRIRDLLAQPGLLSPKILELDPRYRGVEIQTN